ncbi:unnamed protein product [Spodoptera exigua]|nr:unnamed protein product [Spodoptera exigua]
MCTPPTPSTPEASVAGRTRLGLERFHPKPFGRCGVVFVSSVPSLRTAASCRDVASLCHAGRTLVPVAARHAVRRAALALRRACGSAGWSWLFRGVRGEVGPRRRAALRGRRVAGGEGQ